MKWRYVQPKIDQVAVVLMADDDRRIMLVPLTLEFLDHEGFRVPLTQRVSDLIVRWRQRR